MKLLETLVRMLPRCSYGSNRDDLASTAKRLLKLGLHFEKRDAIVGTLVTTAKEFAMNKKLPETQILMDLIEAIPDDSLKEKCLEFWTFLYKKAVLLFSSRAEMLVSKRTDIILEAVRRLSDKAAASFPILSKICSESKDPEVIVACHASCLCVKISPGDAAEWLKMVPDRLSGNVGAIIKTCLILLWSYHAKLEWSGVIQEMKSHKLGVESQVGPDETTILSRTVLLLKVVGYNSQDIPLLNQSLSVSGKMNRGESMESHFLEGSVICAYEHAKVAVADILSDIKTASYENLWHHYTELFDIIDWLLCLSQIGGSHRMVKYYVKMGVTYCESLHANIRRHKYLAIQERLDAKASDSIISDYPVATVGDMLRSMDDQIEKLEEDIEKFHEQKFRFCYRPNDGGPISPFHKGILNSCWLHSGPFRFRRLVSALIAQLTDPIIIMSLIQMTRELELMDIDAGIDLGSFDKVFEKFLELQTMQGPMEFDLFVDVRHEILYVASYQSPLCKSLPCVLVISLQGSFRETCNQLCTVVEDNKKMLFDPMHLLSANDETAKRAWWQTRHELQVRLESIIRAVDQWLAPLGLFLPTGHDTDVSPLPNAHTAVPQGLDARVLVNVLGSNSTIPRKTKLEILTALQIEEEERQWIFKSIEKYERRMPDEERNPFCNPNSVQKRKTLICLSLDRFMHAFPLEACATFSDYLIVRSLSCIEGSLFSRTLETPNVSAVLNPGGDLKPTEDRIRPLLTLLGISQIVCGRTPSRDEMRILLSSSDLSLYFGHGSGEAYLPNTEISKLQPCASSFLFGCSSGRLRHALPWNPEGSLLAYRAANSPLVLANLWDVTDRDIDKLSIEFLALLDISERRRFTIEECSSALEKARSSCLLKILNGAAPVIYIN